MLLHALLLSVLVAANQQSQGDSTPAELSQGRALLEEGRIEEALRLAQRYSGRHPRDPRGFLLLGDAYAQRLPGGRFRAIRAYRDAARLAPSDPQPPYRIAVLAFELGGADGERLAGDHLEKVLEIAPAYEDAWERWLTLYRTRGDREGMIRRLAPHRADPEVRIRIGRLLIELERYDDAAALLDSVMDAGENGIHALALRAQGALEAGDTVVGLDLYYRAIRHADLDSSDLLWSHVVGIATPAEVRAWQAGIPPDRKPAWFEAFWARRNPSLFTGGNHRIVEHFARLRHARREYPLMHPLTLYERSAVFRGLQIAPPSEESRLYHACEATTEGGVAQLSDRIRVFTDPDAPRGSLEGATFAPKFFDLTDADTTAARIGYNLATGFDDRGLLYLRFGPPDAIVIGADNLRDARCRRILMDLERWTYDAIGQVRFANPIEYSRTEHKGPAVNRFLFRPMNEEQFAATAAGITRDATSLPAPLTFGIWTAAFRNADDTTLTDLVIVSTRGRLAANLVHSVTGAGRIVDDPAGSIVIHGAPGAAVLVANVLDSGQLGRQRLAVQLPDFARGRGTSDLLLGVPWEGDSLDRQSMIRHIARDLRFGAGKTVRAYAELYGAGPPGGLVRYTVTYAVLTTSDVRADYERSDWPSATRFEFDRDVVVGANGVTVETLDIAPRWLRPGRYLLRMEVRSPGGSVGGRATATFEVTQPTRPPDGPN